MKQYIVSIDVEFKPGATRLETITNLTESFNKTAAIVKPQVEKIVSKHGGRIINDDVNNILMGAMMLVAVPDAAVKEIEAIKGVRSVDGNEMIFNH